MIKMPAPKSLFKEASVHFCRAASLQKSPHQLAFRERSGTFREGTKPPATNRQQEVTISCLFQMYILSSSPLLFLQQPIFFSPKNQTSDLLLHKVLPGFLIVPFQHPLNIYLQTRDYCSPGTHWQLLPGRRDIVPPLHRPKTTSVGKRILLQQFFSTTNSLILT